MKLEKVQWNIDESIKMFISKLNQIDGVTIHLTKPIKELRHQDYKGKIVLVDIVDEYGYQMEGKIDIGVHKDLDIEQEEYCFDICFIQDGASLLMNSREHIITEKVKSLLCFMARNTRYKDIFKESADVEKLKVCIKQYIYDDNTLEVNNIDDVVSRLEVVFKNQSYIREVNRSNKNWLGIETETVREVHRT